MDSFSKLRNLINENINTNLLIGYEYLEVKRSMSSLKKNLTETEHFNSIKTYYDLLNMMFENIPYDDKWDGINNAILCSVEAFLDYLEEFIYLYKKERYTLLNHCLRGAFESFLALNTLFEHPHGLDILLNQSDKELKNIQLDGAKYYHLGKEEDIQNDYNAKVNKRQFQKTMNTFNQVQLFKGNQEYDSHDLYLLYRFLSGDIHFNIGNEMKKRATQIGDTFKIKAQSKSTSELTMPLHMDILVGHLLILIFRHVFTFD